ncbi:F-box/FBD/LRR-repeat protein At1g13570-like [Apium graveolens]|uniref:F-box/FBD/LRR-repeat protein At1g13570-like n=1 Tax=Apium graveolens TaxID=4045 RepID=UPI003D7AFD82
MSSVCPSLDDDRISNLPLVLKHFILDRAPLHDAVRTSTLSKAWRTTWTTKPSLAFNKLFFLEVISKKNEEEYLSAFSDLVDMILSVHTGPILDVEIYIPPKLHNHHISQWIEHFSRQDVLVLKLDNSENDACLIPSHFYDFVKLRGLRLKKWILSPPHASGCFANLVSVDLYRVSISAHLSFGTKLRNLDLHFCIGIEHLDFTESKNLRRLVINLSSKIDWRWLESTPKMETLILLLPAADINMSESVNLISLLSNFPNLHSLLLHDLTIEILGPVPSAFKTLATKLVNLKRLHLYRLRYNWCQISNSLCLIRNLPNLQQLQVTLNFQVRSSDPENPTIERHLESLDWNDVVLDQLLTVEISDVVGFRSVHHLTRILLASSPSLREMTLFCSATVSDPDEKLRIKRDLLQLPRKSSEAQLHWFDEKLI